MCKGVALKTKFSMRVYLQSLGFYWPNYYSVISLLMCIGYIRDPTIPLISKSSWTQNRTKNKDLVVI
jgi:uncharacterized membrane protein